MEDQRELTSNRCAAAENQVVRTGGGAISRLHGALSSVNLRCNRLLMGRNLVCEFGPRYVLANIRIVPDRW